MNQNQIEGNNNIVIQDITATTITVNVNGELQTIENKFSELKRILESQNKHFVKYQEKIFDLESKLRESNSIIGSENVINNSQIDYIGGNLRIGNDTIINITIINPPNPLENLTKKQRKELEKKKDKRLEMLDALEKRYKERLSKKMEGENLKIEFEPKYTKVGTTKDYRNIVLNHYNEGKTVNTNTLYNDFLKKKQLLIIGEAGSGKTVLLLTIAQKLITEAKKRIEKNDISYPYPILINLSTWRTEDKYTFTEWLEKNLVYAGGRSGIPKKDAKELVEENNMILFLDGLDEIPESDRKGCVEAMKSYFEEKSKNTKFPIGIICCRKKEYLQLKQDLPTRAISEIVPLTLEKVKNQLEAKNITEADILLKRIEENSQAIKEADYLTTVFEINIALSLAQSYLLYDFSLEKLATQNLVDAYIKQEIEKVNEYRVGKKIHYLSFLSKNINSDVFELSNIANRWPNPNLKEKDVTPLSFFFSVSFAMLLITSIVIYCMAEITLVNYVNENYKESRIGINGIFMLYAIKMYLLVIVMKNTLKYRSKKYDSLTIKLNIKSLKIKVIFQISIVMFSSTLILSFFEESIFENIHFVLMSLIFGIVLNFLGSSSIVSIRTPYFKQPYTKLINTFIYSFAMFTPYLFISLFSLYVTTNYSVANDIAIKYIYSFAVIMFLMSDASSFCVEYILLLKKGKIPRKLVSFLNKVSQTGLMEKDGGQWRFRHQLIQDRLAGKEIKKN